MCLLMSHYICPSKRDCFGQLIVELDSITDPSVVTIVCDRCGAVVAVLTEKAQPPPASSLLNHIAGNDKGAVEWTVYVPSDGRVQALV
jgi:hypothetical protein